MRTLGFSVFFNPIGFELPILTFPAAIREGKLAIINTEDIHEFLAASSWLLDGSTGNGQSKYGYVRVKFSQVSVKILY